MRRGEQRGELRTWKERGDVAMNRKLLVSALGIVSEGMKNEMPLTMAGVGTVILQGFFFFFFEDTGSISDNDSITKMSQRNQKDMTVMSVKHFQYTSCTLGCALNIFSAFVGKHVCVRSFNMNLLKLCEEPVVKILL